MTIPRYLQICKFCKFIKTTIPGTKVCSRHNIDLDKGLGCGDFDYGIPPEQWVLDAYNEIIQAYMFLREHNHSISDETLDFIKIASIKALRDEI